MVVPQIDGEGGTRRPPTVVASNGIAQLRDDALARIDEDEAVRLDPVRPDVEGQMLQPRLVEPFPDDVASDGRTPLYQSDPDTNAGSQRRIHLPPPACG